MPLFFLWPEGKISGSVNGKCLTGAKRKEFKELIRATDFPPSWLFQMHIWKLPTGEGAPERVGGWGLEWRGSRGNFFPRGFGQSPWFFLLILGDKFEPLRKSAMVKCHLLLREKATAAGGDFFAFDLGGAVTLE